MRRVLVALVLLLAAAAAIHCVVSDTAPANDYDVFNSVVAAVDASQCDVVYVQSSNETLLFDDTVVVELPDS